MSQNLAANSMRAHSEIECIIPFLLLLRQVEIELFTDDDEAEPPPLPAADFVHEVIEEVMNVPHVHEEADEVAPAADTPKLGSSTPFAKAAGIVRAGRHGTLTSMASNLGCSSLSWVQASPFLEGNGQIESDR